MPGLQPIASTYTRPVTVLVTPTIAAPSIHHATDTAKLSMSKSTHAPEFRHMDRFWDIAMATSQQYLQEVFQSTENQLSCTGYAKILPRGHCENHQLSMNLENTRGRCESPCSSDGMMCSTFVNCSGRRKSPEVTLL